jgi:hypothetical protein
MGSCPNSCARPPRVRRGATRSTRNDATRFVVRGSLGSTGARGGSAHWRCFQTLRAVV